MGVKGLYTYLKPYRRSISPEYTEPLRIGVDAMSLIYKYKNTYKSIFAHIDVLKKKGHTIIFVFDGKAPAEKAPEITERREARLTASTHAASLKDALNDPNLSPKERAVLEGSVARLELQGWHLTRDIRHEIHDGLVEMGIDCVRAKEEADQLLAAMACNGHVDVVVSTDMDFLLSGVERLWIPGVRADYEEIILSEVLHGEGVSKVGFVDAGILCGVEPLHGAISVPPKTAFMWIHHYGSMEKLLLQRADLTELDIIREPGKLERVRRHYVSADSVKN